ncbi:MAG: hypothetical protein D4R67_02990 [Bacteroidetes bacterium]|nr:MAG: hypothetical protein D4R67_02990 [Bacteroidota bacterium]
MKIFSTPPIPFSVSQVDESLGILHRVVVAQSGKVKSYFEMIDTTTLAQIESLGNAREKGVKARFGHPNMCSSSFGTYIGRFRNFIMEGDSVCADLHLDEICKDSPSGNLYDYIIKMAKNNPDMFGASIAFVPGKPEATDAEFPSTRIEELLATDLVDDPAATNSLFAVDAFAYQATAFLDANPAIVSLIASKPETIIEFMLKYYSNNDIMKKEMFQRLRNLFNAGEVSSESVSAEVTELEKRFDESSTAIGEIYADVLEKVRKNPLAVWKFDFVAETPASSDSVLAAIEVTADLSLEKMFEDLRILVFGQQAHISNIMEYYNSVIDRLQLDHQSEAKGLNQTITDHQNEAYTLNQRILEQDQQLTSLNEQITSLQTQISTLQDRLKAAPTTVESIDPKLSISKPEESYGKKLLSQMPTQLKEKLETKQCHCESRSAG